MNKSTPYDFIGSFAKLYDRFLKFTGYEGEIMYFLNQLPFENNASLRVLDTACGTGPYTMAILKKYPNAKTVSFDLNPKLVGRLNDKLQENGLEQRARAFVGNVRGPLPEISGEKFDLVVVAGILEHVPLEETAAFLTTFVNKDGYILSSPTRTNLLGKCIDWLYGCWPNTREANLAAFTQNGFVLRKLIVPKSFKELHILQKQV